MGRALTAAKISLVNALWCWVLTAIHGIWSIGVLLDYLNGMQPLYPSLPVNYGTFFTYSIGAFALCFLLTLVASATLPRRFHLYAVLAAWLIGAYWGAADTAFAFQIDFGTTWAPTEAVRALFYHPIFTPFATLFGMAGAASFTRRWRLMAP